MLAVWLGLYSIISIHTLTQRVTDTRKGNNRHAYISIHTLTQRVTIACGSHLR